MPPERIAPAPAGNHRLSRLAQLAAPSERHLRHLPAAQTGTRPARVTTHVRVEAARELLQDTGTPVEMIATRCGFGSPETMRRAFLRTLGVGPADYRLRCPSQSIGIA